jgi:2-haloacid dehalogenase
VKSRRAWHRLDAWPDVSRGLHQLKRRFLLAPVSNGNISLMVDLARRNGLPWDAILGAEIAGDYKPKPRVYLAAAEAFDLPPGACMMVAAHTNDLIHAAACGLRTAHVARPNERGEGRFVGGRIVRADRLLQQLAHPIDRPSDNETGITVVLLKVDARDHARSARQTST